MKISWNWLQEILPVQLSVDAAAELLTDIGLEVESVSAYASIRGGLEGLVTGKVMTCEKHPDADKLKLTTVDIGTGTLLPIVCGAPNVEAGQMVIVATIGTTIYPVNAEPFTIKKAKIRGQESAGMLCADDEIGLGESHAGLHILPAETPIGIPVKNLFDVYTDHIIEIGLTANHADANSHIGTARELKAALEVRQGIVNALQYPKVKNITVNQHTPVITVAVEDDACKRYSGIYIEQVRITESPKWLQNKLRAVGMRPINAVVDITNYVLHTYGQPLHAFDADKIKDNRVIVKKLTAGTPFVTLDNKTHKLSANDLMICDAEAGLCIAGVYGGLSSGVTEQTTRIFLESAWFDPAHIRRTESLHGLKTDASARFAKGTDIEITVAALQLATALIVDICGGVVKGDISDFYPAPMAPFSVQLRLSRLRAISSIDMPVETVKQILQSLGIHITSYTDGVLQTAVPTYKNDVVREIDLIEEILRLYGFNKIPIPNSVRTPYLVTPKPDRELIKMNMIRYLSAQGAYEIATNAIGKSKFNQQFLPQLAEQQVSLLNSLNIELDSMRLTLAFTGLEVIAYNHSHKQTDLRLFEFGRTYRVQQGAYIENDVLAMYMTGNAYDETWRIPQRKIDIFDLQEQVQSVCNRMGLQIDWQVQEHPINGIFSSAVCLTEGQKTFGIAGTIKQEVCAAFGIRTPVYYAEIDWASLIDRAGNRSVVFREIQKYPEVRRDLALVIDRQTTYQAVERIARQEGKQLLRDIRLFDVFEGEQLAGKKSYAIGLTFSDATKTLTDVEIEPVMQKMMQRYEKELGAIIRK